MQKSIKKYKAFFDGSAKPNPGIMKIGGLVKDESGTIKGNYSKEIGQGTNNEAEYLSLIVLVRGLVKAGVKNVTIYGDSLLVVNQVNRIWKAKDQRMVANRDKVLEMLADIPEWRLEHVKRNFNTEADNLTR